jgi:hypothetical protein
MAAPEASAGVTVRPGAAADRPLLAGLMQFYTYDFSEMEPAGSLRFDVGPDGLFARYPPLDFYWSEPGHWPLVIEADGRPAGFALVNTLSRRGGTPDRNMAEFFIARKFRRHGAGQSAVRQILALHPGRWEVAVAARNLVAAAFWPRALTAADVADLQPHRGDGEAWIGEIWTFRA